VRGDGERGLAMIAVLATILIVTTIGVSVVGLMSTDMLHASVQNAVARSFYLAQSGLEEAKIQVGAAAEPQSYATPSRGVAAPYGGGRFTYWVDAGPATGCGPGLKTLEALGEVPFLRASISSRVRACGVPGTPVATALFGVSRVELQGSSRMYLAPAAVGAPGGGGSLGSFTEVHFADPEVRLNALSETEVDTLTLRDVGAVGDYALFGFPARPIYDPNPETDPAPWVLAAFGELIKAQPVGSALSNRCGTAHACVTAQGLLGDITTVPALRGAVNGRTSDAAGMSHVYVNRIREAVMPLLSLDPDAYLNQAADNQGNAAIDKLSGLPNKKDSVYTPLEFYQIVAYLADHPGQALHGGLYIAGTLELPQSLDLGGTAGDVTLAVGGDLILDKNARLTNRHDLTSVAGRETPGIVVLGLPAADQAPLVICGGARASGTGRLVLCGGPRQRLTVDGLVYTADGMVVGPGAVVDQIGAMYHNNRGTANPSFASRDATVALRFDPLALSAFGRGLAILSWQQLK